MTQPAAITNPDYSSTCSSPRLLAAGRLRPPRAAAQRMIEDAAVDELRQWVREVTSVQQECNTILHVQWMGSKDAGAGARSS